MNIKYIAYVYGFAAALSLAAAPAMAGKPSPQVAAAARHCMAARPGSEQDAGRHAASGWYGAQAQALPAYLRGLLRDEDRANLDSAADPCRLADKDPKDDAIPNDGKADIPKLLGKIDDWMALNRHQDAESEHNLEWYGQRVSFEFEGPDHRPQAYIGNGRTDSVHAGNWSQHWEPLVWREDIGGKAGVAGPLHAAVDQNGQHTDLSANNLSAVPESATYAMLLAGLATIGLALRARRRAG